MARHSEDNSQIAIIEWFRTLQGYGKIQKHYILAHNNNSTQYLDSYAKRNFWKKRGGVTGMPDLVLYAGFEGLHGMFIEIKSESHKPKRKVDHDWWVHIKPDADGKETTSHGVTSTQSAVMNKLQEAGYLCVVCFSSNEAIKVIENYLHLVTGVIL